LLKGFSCHLFKVIDSDFTSEQKIKFDKIKYLVAKKGIRIMSKTFSICAYENTVMSMKNKTASKILKELFDIYNSLQEN
jgi:hypothetical protein